MVKRYPRYLLGFQKILAFSKKNQRSCGRARELYTPIGNGFSGLFFSWDIYGKEAIGRISFHECIERRGDSGAGCVR